MKILSWLLAVLLLGLLLNAWFSGDPFTWFGSLLVVGLVIAVVGIFKS